MVTSFVEAATHWHGLSLLASAVPGWYLFKDEILEKQRERAADIASKLRGDMSAGLAKELERFTNDAREAVLKKVEIILPGADAAEIQRVDAFSSEGFKETVIAFFDAKGALVRNYQKAEDLKGGLRTLKKVISWLIGTWICVACLVCGYFVLCTLDVTQAFSDETMKTITVAGLAPIAVLVATVPFLVFYTVRLANLDHR